MKQKLIVLCGASVVAVAAISICSCGGGSSTALYESELVNIELSQDNRLLAGDAIAEREIVRLDSKKGVVGETQNMIVTDNNIVISDKSSVFVFDRKGNSISRISRQGRGPQDYVQLTHMTLTPDNDKIAIYDNLGNKVLLFSLDGNFISSMPAKFWFAKMEYVSPDNVVSISYGTGREDPALRKHGSRDDLVYFMNDELEIEESCVPLTYTREKFYLISPTIHKFGETVYIKPVTSDTVYIARDRTLVPKYRVDTKKIGGEANFANEITSSEYEALIKRAAEFFDFVDADEHSNFSVSTPPDSKVDHYLYSKKTGKVYYFERMNLKSAAEFMDYTVMSPKTSYEDKLVSLVEAFHIAQFQEALKATIPETADIKEEDNPVVVLYTLKDSL